MTALNVHRTVVRGKIDGCYLLESSCGSTGRTIGVVGWCNCSVVVLIDRFRFDDGLEELSWRWTMISSSHSRLIAFSTSRRQYTCTCSTWTAVFVSIHIDWRDRWSRRGANTLQTRKRINKNLLSSNARQRTLGAFSSLSPRFVMTSEIRTDEIDVLPMAYWLRTLSQSVKKSTKLCVLISSIWKKIRYEWFSSRLLADVLPVSVY